jgi:hypothetical protein
MTKEEKNKQRRQYIRQKKIFLRQHSDCPVYPGNRTTDIHHIQGRLGPLLTDERFWLAVSRSGHDWIHAHPEESRQKGWLCEKGKWNQID